MKILNVYKLLWEIVNIYMNKPFEIIKESIDVPWINSGEKFMDF